MSAVVDAGMPDDDVTDGAAVDKAEVVIVEVVAGDIATTELSLADVSLPAAPLTPSFSTTTAMAASFRESNGDASTESGDAASESSSAAEYLLPLPAGAATAPPYEGEDATQSEPLFRLSLGEDDCSFRA